MISTASASSDIARGQLKIYLGYAPGVGKTFQMLSDAHVWVCRGVDLVVGYFEAHQRQDTLALAEGLELIPRRQVVYRDRTFEEMDTSVILRRKPQLCLVDELAHTNVPGAEREKRWEDVLVLLDAGVDAWTTLNVQHIESLNDTVFECTGVRVRETVPDWVVKQAAEIVLVDVTPEALLNRLRRGAVYTANMAQRAVESFFRESNLRVLRELAMREAAHEVQVRKDEHDVETGQVSSGVAAEAGFVPASAATKERILVFITADPANAMLVRRGRRVADYLQGDCLALFVHRQEHFTDLPAGEREAVERHLNFARNLGVETRILQGREIPRTVVEFARRNQVTQIFLSRALLRARPRLLGADLVRDIIRIARDIQITVVATRPREKTDEVLSTPSKV
jgi:two-component system sensor histidine kinase KdpD